MRKKILYLIVGFFFFFITFFSFYFSKVNFVESFTQLESISDTISTSHGESGANHRIRFRVTSDVFGGGKIVFQPISKPGSAFNIPPEMDYTDVGLFVNDDEKPLSSEPSEDVSGVNFISGEEGQITITLADNLFLNEGDIVVIQIGKNNNQIVNPSVNAAYWIRIRIFSSTDTLLSTGETAIFILDPVNVGMQTLVPEPIVGTVPASVIGANAVVLRGQLLNMGPAEEVDVFFEYREMDSEDWKRTGKFGRKSIVNFSEFVAGLEAGTEYEFRAAVEWEEEGETLENFGQILTFITMEQDPGEGAGEGEGEGAGEGAGTGLIDRGGGPGGPDEGIREGEPADPPPPEIQDPPPYLGLYGWAYPNGEVILIRNQEEIARTRTNSLGEFTIEINEPSSNTFNFILKGKGLEKDDLVSTDISFTLEMNPTRGLIIRKIMLSPVTEVSKDFFLMEEPINIFGRAVPENQVNVQILKEDIVIVDETVNVDSNGRWSFSLAPGVLERGRYMTRARSFAFEEKSAFGGFSAFGISELGCDVADIIKDGRVGISDFSVLMHYWNTGETRADLNNDGIVDLVDFSIMMNCWTG